MSLRRLLVGLAVLIPAGLLAYALSAAEPKPAADGLEEKEEKFDYTIKGETKHGTRKVMTLDLGGGVTMEFVRIPARHIPDGFAGIRQGCAPTGEAAA